MSVWAKSVLRETHTCVFPQSMLQDDVYLRNIAIRRIDPLILHVIFIIEHVVIIFVVIGNLRGLSGREADIGLYSRFRDSGL